MEISLDYLAGVIDGEGTITLSRKHKTDKWRTPVVSVSSTTAEILNAITLRFGGHVCKHKAYQPHHRPAFSWRIEGRKAIELCGLLQDRLLVPEKRRRARLISRQYLKCTPRNGKYTEQQLTQKTHFEQEFFATAS